MKMCAWAFLNRTHEAVNKCYHHLQTLNLLNPNASFLSLNHQSHIMNKFWYGYGTHDHDHLALSRFHTCVLVWTLDQSSSELSTIGEV